MTRTVILVADSARAKIYMADKLTAELREVEDFIAPEGRMHEQDLVADRPGSARGAMGQGQRVLDERTSAHTEAQLAFARRLAERLEEERQGDRFDRFVCVAPAAMLGILRQEFSDPLTKIMVETVEKNLVQHSAQEVRDHISTLR